MTEHFAHQAPDGKWHAVYRRPGCNELLSVGDALTQRGAQGIADAANRGQARHAREQAALMVDPFERRLPRGLYTDEDGG